MDLNEPPVGPDGRAFRPARADRAFAVGALVAGLLYVVACAAGGGYDSAFFAIPFFVGFVVGMLAPRRPYATSFAVLGVSILLAILTFREGVICALFSLPVLVPFLLLGAFAGSVLSRRVPRARDRHGLSGLVVFLGVGWQLYAGVADDPLTHPLHTASAARLVDAPPEEVFEALATGDVRLAPRWPWFLRIGLPIPERMTVDRAGPDGRLHFDFSQGTAFAEVTAWNAPRELAYAVTRYEVHDLPFHITRLGRTPDYGFRKERVEDWLSIESTRYELVPAPGGKTWLRRSIVWRRHLTPDFYFGWLQQSIMARGQARLLELIAESVRDRAPKKGLAPTKTAALW